MREDWEYKTFGEVGTFLRGKNIQKADFVEHGLPCIHYGQIHTKFGVSVNKHLSEIPEEVYNKSIIASPGDIVIAITSEDLEGSCKSTAWLGDYDVAVSSHAAVYKHNLNPKFIAYYLRSKSFYIEKEKYARGFKVMEIKPTDIARIPIPVPSEIIQSRVVSELDKINELIRLKKEQLKDYDNLAQSIFYEMFGDPVANDKEWEVKKLGDVCKFTQGTQVPIEEQHLSKENGLVQFLRIIDFTQGKDAPRFVKCSNDKYILHEREIAIVRYGTPGFVCYGKIGAIANNLFKITPNQKDMFEFEFLVHWLNTEAFQSAVKSKQYGAALQAIKFSTIQGINIIIPSLTVQRSFATRISQIDKQKQYIEESIKELESLLASRMQYWFD